MDKHSICTSKFISAQEFSQIREVFKIEGKKVIHCHGVFDLVHPGHIAHLSEAKNLGDILVVSITSSPYVNKGPGRPYFSDELRMKTLAALECVDYVILSEAETVIEVMDFIRPDLYVKGAEYATSANDISMNIDIEVQKVRSLGGDVYFTCGDIVFSSTKIINNSFNSMPENVVSFMKSLSERYSFNQIKGMVDGMKSIKILVVGDVIIDNYTFCLVQGLMSKDTAFSAKYENEECYLGGSLAVARHLASFSNNVTVCSVVGDDPHIHSRILNDLGKDMLLDLQYHSGFKTVVKRRFIERRGIRDEYAKLFSVNYLNNEDEIGMLDKTDFYMRLERIVPEYDMVVLTDFGHGLVDRKVMEILQEESKFLALNCQTNSSNFGTNLITKYTRADCFCLDEKELRLAMSDRHEDVDVLLKKLNNHFNSNAGWVTLGSLGSAAVDLEENIVKCPALTLKVQDTVGAGDAFFVAASMGAFLQLPLEISSFLGNTAGALAANVLGNAKPVRKSDLLKFASTLMNF